MNVLDESKLRKKIKNLIIIFIVFLSLSGITAFPLEWELSILTDLTKNAPTYISEWINSVYEAIKETNSKYPYMSYGTDWLAFAHLVIAVAFIGPLKDPVRNIWVIQFGMYACLMVLPLALLCGPIRHIPFYWRIIDCSFGIIGIIPLYICYKYILKLEQLTLNK